MAISELMLRRGELTKSAARQALRLHDPRYVAALHVCSIEDLPPFTEIDVEHFDRATFVQVDTTTLPSPASHWPWSPTDEQAQRHRQLVTTAGA